MAGKRRWPSKFERDRAAGRQQQADDALDGAVDALLAEQVVMDPGWADWRAEQEQG